MRRLLTTLCLLAALTLHGKEWTPAQVTDVIRQVNTYWQSHHPAEVRAFWDNAAYHTGNMEVYKVLKDSLMLDYTLRWAEHNRWQGATETDPSKWKYKQYGEGQDHVLFGDWQICFQTYLDLYSLHPDPIRIARACEVMDYEASSPASDYWWWADALYMVMPVMTKMYRLTGERKFLDKLYENIRYSDSIMLDDETGLYFRDAKYVYPKHQTANGHKDFWARGDGWVLAGLAKVLQDMPRDYVRQPFFVEKFQRLARTVAALQQPEGYWTRSMADPQQAPGPETSGTAFFCYGLLWGVNNGYLSAHEYAPVIARAWHYLTATALQPDGRVGYVQPIGERAIPGQQVGAQSQANFGVGAFLLASCEYYRYLRGGRVTLTIRNTTQQLRQEVVEVCLRDVCGLMGVSDTTSLVVRDARGREVPSQRTYDGRLLLFTTVKAQSTAAYTLTRGTPTAPKSYVHGRMYPERADDITWENDLTIYRVYGPTLQRSGEKSYGTDVWVKNTPDLVVHHRYSQHLRGVALRDSLRAIGQPKEADDVYRATSFHHDHGQGLDCYAVGASLGCGAPALMKQDTLLFPYCYRDYRILDNGPLRFTVELTYAANADGVTEHRLISLDRASHFNRTTVWYDGIGEPLSLAAGVVMHDDGQPVLTPHYVQYADPTDNPTLHRSNIFVATLFPKAADRTLLLPGHPAHAVGIIDDYRGEPYTYWFGAAWSKYDIADRSCWQQCIDDFLFRLDNPLTRSLQ